MNNYDDFGEQIKRSVTSSANWINDVINDIHSGVVNQTNNVRNTQTYREVQAERARLQAERQRQLQPREIRADVGSEGDWYPLYSTVLVQIPQLLQGLNSSVIRKVTTNQSGNITKIEISDLVEFVSGSRYGVIIQATNEFGFKIYSGEVTGTGKTRLAKRIPGRNDIVLFTQFHAETSYSDFVYGIVPKVDSTVLGYSLHEGVFVQAIREALKTENAEKKFFLLSTK